MDVLLLLLLGGGNMCDDGQQYSRRHPQQEMHANSWPDATPATLEIKQSPIRSDWMCVGRGGGHTLSLIPAPGQTDRDRMIMFLGGEGRGHHLEVLARRKDE